MRTFEDIAQERERRAVWAPQTLLFLIQPRDLRSQRIGAGP